MLLDEGLPRRAADDLRALGWDAEHVTEVQLGGEADRDILAAARGAGRTVVTLDSDFGTLLARSGEAAPSVLFLRFHGLGRPETVAAVTALPPEAVEALREGAIVVHDGKALRIRRLPIS